MSDTSVKLIFERGVLTKVLVVRGSSLCRVSVCDKSVPYQFHTELLRRFCTHFLRLVHLSHTQDIHAQSLALVV